MDRLIHKPSSEKGFSMVELLISTLILTIVGGYVFSAMVEMERTSSYETEVNAVLDNSRMAMETVQRYLKHAGNNPLGIALQGITIVSPQEVRIQADLTGSTPPGSNRGDPDGDINDLDEDVTLRYNANARTIEIVPTGQNPRTVASYIANFSMQYLDAAGAATTVGADVASIQVTISASSQIPNPKTRQTYGITEACNLQLISR